jgi:secretion/DNA translocation related CpaE-like protein
MKIADGGAHTGSADACRPLLICSDALLSEELVRIAAAAGVEVNHAAEPASRAGWVAASIVVIHESSVAAALGSGLPRRPKVVVVTGPEPSPALWQDCVSLGAEHTVVLPEQERSLVQFLADTGTDNPGDGRLVALVGARGGAGASVLAAAVAVAGVRAGPGVLLADCDPWGAGQDLLFGLESDPGLRWPDLAAGPALGGRVPIAALHQALPSMTDRPPARNAKKGAVLSVLSFGKNASVRGSVQALDSILEACRHAGELVVVDAPREPDSAADHAIERADLVVLVAAADLPSCYAGLRVSRRLEKLNPRVVTVVRGPSPGGLGPAEVAAAVELPLLVSMRPQPRLARDLEHGKPPGSDPRTPLARAATQVLAATVGVG